MLKFAVDGTEYDFDKSLTIAEAMLVKTCTGLSAGQFLSGIGEMDAAALGAVVLLCKIRAGEETTWSDLGSLDLIALIESIGERNNTDDPEESGDESADADEPPEAPAAA